MFGFSLGKLLILVVLLLVGWYGLRYIGLKDAARKQKRKFARDAAAINRLSTPIVSRSRSS